MWLTIAFCSALLSAAAAVVQKKILFRIDAVTFSFLLSAVVMLISLGIPLIVDVTAVSSLTFLILFVKSIINALAFLLVMMALERFDISGTLPLLALTPAVTALLAFAAIGDSISLRETLAMVLMMAGAFLVERNAMWRRTAPLTEQWPVWTALILFAVSAVMDKELVGGQKVSPLLVLFYQHFIFLVVYASLFFRKRERIVKLAAKEWRTIMLLVAAVAVLTLGYRYTQLDAVKTGPVALVLAIKRTSVLFASLVGGRMFKEKKLAPRLAGAAFIVAAGFWILRNVG